MEANQKKEYPLEFWGTNLLSLVPFVLFAFCCVLFFVILKVFAMEALAMGGIVSLIIGSVLAKNQGKYWEAVVKGMCSEMAGTLALILLSVGIFTAMVKYGHVTEGFVWIGSQIGLKGALFTVFTFVATCLIAGSTGTSIGTLFSCFPILYPAGVLLGADPLFLAGAILSGAMFGDNIGPISDSTIASASTQEYTRRSGRADIAGVVKSRMRYALVGAGIAIIGFFIFGGKRLDSAEAQALLAQYSDPKGLIMLIPVAILLTVAVIKRNIFISITWGIVSGIVIGLLTGVLKPTDIMLAKDGDLHGFMYEGIVGMLGLVVYLYGVFGIMGVLRECGTMDRFIQALINSKLARTTFGTELILGIGIVVSCICLGAANGPAIVMFGPVADQLGKTKKLHPYRRANMIDAMACGLPVVFPFTSAFIFIVMICVSGLMGQYDFIKPLNPFHLVYATLHCWALAIVVILAMVTGWGRTYEGKDGIPVKTLAEGEK